MRRWLLLAVLLAGCGEDGASAGGSRAGCPARAPIAPAPRRRLLADDGPRPLRRHRPGWRARRTVARVSPQTARSVALDGPPIARAGRVRRAVGAGRQRHALPDRGRAGRAPRSTSTLQAPYNLWAGAGSLWAVDDRAGEVIRIDPRAVRSRPGSRSATGRPTWPSTATTAWIVNHRDRALVALDTRTNRRATARDARRATRPSGSRCSAARSGSPAAAPTSCASIQRSGRVMETIEIGGSGIDVVAAGGALVGPERAARRSTRPGSRRWTRCGGWSRRRRGHVRRRGRPRSTSTACSRDGDGVWLADTTAGFVYRF